MLSIVADKEKCANNGLKLAEDNDKRGKKHNKGLQLNA